MLVPPSEVRARPGAPPVLLVRQLKLPPPPVPGVVREYDGCLSTSSPSSSDSVLDVSPASGTMAATMLRIGSSYCRLISCPGGVALACGWLWPAPCGEARLEEEACLRVCLGATAEVLVGSWHAWSFPDCSLCLVTATATGRCSLGKSPCAVIVQVAVAHVRAVMRMRLCLL
jgi:hypothetical protein